MRQVLLAGIVAVGMTLPVLAQNPLVLPLDFPDWIPPAPSGRPPAVIEPGGRRITEPDAYPPRRVPEFSVSTTNPEGNAQTHYFDRNGVLIGSDYSSPYLGDPIGYRTATTLHFNDRRQQIGISHITLHRSGYARTTHWNNFGQLTGMTVEDWLGRRTEYDPQGKWLQTTTTIVPLATQLREHPNIPLSDGIGSLEDPRWRSAQSVSSDLSGATTWSGVSVATLKPRGNVKLQHYNRNNFRTGASEVQPPFPIGRSQQFRAEHFDPNYQQAGRSELVRDESGQRKAITYDPFGHPIARTVTTPGGSSFRYDFTGKLIGTSQ
jgi:YD repeat-containing protein